MVQDRFEADFLTDLERRKLKSTVVSDATRFMLHDLVVHLCLAQIPDREGLRLGECAATYCRFMDHVCCVCSSPAL
jgi:hypothetical protein